jgi:hypothetical protein
VKGLQPQDDGLSGVRAMPNLEQVDALKHWKTQRVVGRLLRLLDQRLLIRRLERSDLCEQSPSSGIHCVAPLRTSRCAVEHWGDGSSQPACLR